MFWGLLLKANKRYSQTVSKPFHISHATLDLNSADLGDEVVQVWVQTDDVNHLLCNLDKRSSQVSLDLAFSENEVIAFYSKGSGVVHLTGFLLPDDSEYPFGGMGEELEDEEVSDEEVAVIKSIKKGKAAPEEDDDDDDDSELDENELLSDDDEDEELDEEEGEEEEEEEDDDDDEMVAPPPAKFAKVDKSAKENGLVNGKAAAKQEQKKKKKDKKEKPQPNAGQSQPNASQSQTPKTTPRQLAAGVSVEDLRPGKGPEAKAGRKVSVYYEGRLKSNNKVFDSTKAGDGFKFRLGGGEVIKGWDIGVAGMKVGGKRRITCPPNAAYGPKGQPPTIPANSTLIFDVELRGVN